MKSKTVGDAKTGFARIKTEIFPTRLFSPTKFRVYLWIRPEAKYTRGVLHRLLDLSNLVFVVLTSVIAVSDFWRDKRSCQIEQLSLTNCHGCKSIMAEIRYAPRSSRKHFVFSSRFFRLILRSPSSTAGKLFHPSLYA